jgi:hypothetical protein
MSSIRLALACAALGVCGAPNASAHGRVGDRFFPATIAVEDPVAADELGFPTANLQDGESEYELEWAKRITPHLAFSLGSAYVRGDEGDGFGNLETGLKYQFYTDEAHEAVLAAGVDVEWGGTGAARVGAEEVTTIAPTLYFGRGFGDSSADWLRPVAVTGSLAYVQGLRNRTDDGEAVPHSVSYGLTLQYSLPYLAAQVHDYGWPRWVNRLTPIVEVAIDQPVANRGDERTTGTINPGLLWSGRYVQLGAEAIIPINDESGDSVGAALQLHFYVDDLFPRSLGRPFFGAQP